MKRTAAREIAVRLCFTLAENPGDAEQFVKQTFDDEYYSTLQEEDKIYSAKPDEKQYNYILTLVKGVQEHAAELEGYIEKYSVGWKTERISGTAVAIMKVAMFEVLYMPEVPERAAINEAIELAKCYEMPETCAFINGILGSFSRAQIAEDIIEGQQDG